MKKEYNQIQEIILHVRVAGRKNYIKVRKQDEYSHTNYTVKYAIHNDIHDKWTVFNTRYKTKVHVHEKQNSASKGLSFLAVAG